MKRFLLATLLLLSLRAGASHIVGGEIEVIYLSPNKYEIRLIYYFDVVNNGFNGIPPEQQEPFITVRVFQKFNNVPIADFALQFVSRNRVDYTQPECSNGEIVTDKLIYSAQVTLSDALYSHPDGYYIAWDRCCRNYTINNIFSVNPSTSSINYAGQTFYIEFPPVTKNGEQFINSTPQLFPPLNDYACPHKPYWADFAGTDADGDSLVYSLVTPLSTPTPNATPSLMAGPYPEIKWKPGFSLNNILNGAPDLKVSPDGLLTVTPTLQGLYVFAVKCEEFRDGVKLGEVRRDFQMLVVDGCEPAAPPQVKGKTIAAASFNNGEDLVVTFPNTVTDAARCIQVQVSDPDASDALNDFTEKVSIKAVPLNYRGNVNNFVKLPSVTNAVLTNGSTITFDICFDDCPPIEAGPVQIGIVAYDDACALPLTDTLRVNVNVQPPTNTNVVFTTADVNQNPPINEGDKVTYLIRAYDADGDAININFSNDGFNMGTVGMSLNPKQNSGGVYETELVWDTRCDVYDFRTKTNFQVKVIAEDQDVCLYTHPDLMTLNLAVKLPGNSNPVISTDLIPSEVDDGVLVVNKKIFESLSFNVFGKDLIDRDTLELTGSGLGFQFPQYQVSFPGAVSNVGDAQSVFNWNLTCENINPDTKSEFDFRFIVVDNSNKCRFYKADTLDVRVFVDPPDNAKPVLNIVNNNPDLELNEAYEIEALIGQPLDLTVSSDDPDTSPQEDIVTLELVGVQGTPSPPSGYEFENSEGLGFVESNFTWSPECAIFVNGDYENEYFFTFRVLDDRCYAEKGDTVTMKVVVRDIEANDTEFLPPNFVSTNGDEINNFFAMLKWNEDTGEFDDILPLDNCFGHFESVAIYNRWGRELFTSRSRDFRWTPVNEAAGVYYYTLKYSHKEYKGTITIMN